MTLRSALFDDIYFSAADGLAETRHTFLAGNDLPAAWDGRPVFTIGETGFGTGLNFLAAWTLFAETARPGQRLHYVSVEKYPLARDDIARALAPWAGLFGGRLGDLLRLYPLRVPGFHRVLFGDGVALTLVFDDVNDALPGLDAPRGVDAWFLDGFAPAKNPDMWTDALFAQMARLSRPGATAASFTAAGTVGFTAATGAGAASTAAAAGRDHDDHGKRQHRQKGLTPSHPLTASCYLRQGTKTVWSSPARSIASRARTRASSSTSCSRSKPTSSPSRATCTHRRHRWTRGLPGSEPMPALSTDRPSPHPARLRRPSPRTHPR